LLEEKICLLGFLNSFIYFVSSGLGLLVRSLETF